MHRKELINKICDDTGLNLEDIDDVLTSFFNNVIERVSKLEPVTIPGFGVFEPRFLKETRARDVVRGIEIRNPAHYKPAFRAGRDFRALVKKRNEVKPAKK